MRLLRFFATGLVALIMTSATTSCVSYSKFSKLEQRVNDLSSQVTTATADADNDGVPDSRDLEPRTPGDVNVDRFGRTVVERKQQVITTQPVQTPPVQTNPQNTNSMGAPSQPANTVDNRPSPTPVEEPDDFNTPPTNSGGAQYHTIERGDTLFSLARKYNTTVQELRRLNNMPDNKIEIGQRLRVK